MFLLQATLGLLLGVSLGRTKLIMFGSIFATYFGGPGLISYEITRILISTGRDYFELCDDGEVVTDTQIKRQIEAKATYVGLGLLMALLMANLNWQGLGTPANVMLTSIAVIVGFGFNVPFLTLFIAVAAFCASSKYLGLANAPILALIFLSGFRSKVAKSRLQLAQEIEAPLFDPVVYLNGIAVGAVPGVGTGLLTQSAVSAWNVTALAEGYAIGTNLFLKSSGKSALGALLSQFDPTLDTTIGIICVAMTIIFCAGTYGFARWAMKPIELPDWLCLFVSTVAYAWLLAIPDNPGLTWLIAGGVTAVGCIIGRLNVLLPQRFTNGLAAAPIALL